MPRLLVIDGSSMLSSNYYGSLPPSVKYAKTEEEKEAAYSDIMQTSDGIYTNGIHSSLRMVLDIIHDFPEVTHMAVVFDVTRDTFRRRIDPNYKAQRKPTPSPLTMQFKHMQRILHRIGVQVLASPDFEADDLAGSLITKFKSPEMPCTFMTKDHDYLQLVDDDVTGWMTQVSQEKADDIMKRRFGGIVPDTVHVPNKTAYFDGLTVIQQEGVLPAQIPDKKGLCGDASDNIPGVPGVGPAAVIPLLMAYGTIEDIYGDIDKARTEQDVADLNRTWKLQHGINRSPYKKLAENRKSAMLSKELATIKRDVDIPIELTELEIRIDKPALQDVVTRYEMNSLANVVWR